MDENAHIRVGSGKTPGLQAVGGAVADLDLLFFQSSLKIAGNGLTAQSLSMKFGVKDSILVGAAFFGGSYGRIQIFLIGYESHILSIGGAGADADLSGADAV